MSHIGGLKNLVNNFSRKEVPTMTEQALRKMIATGESTQQELPFETKDGMIIFTLDFANSELPVMLFRLVPQTTVL